MKTPEKELLNVIKKNVQEDKICFKYKPNILSKYMNLKDSPPFESYFKKQFLRIIRNNTNKYSFFTKAGKIQDTSLLESIIFKIKESSQSKIKFIDNSKNTIKVSDITNTNKNNSISKANNTNNNDKKYNVENSNNNIADNINNINSNNGNLYNDKISNNNNSKKNKKNKNSLNNNSNIGHKSKVIEQKLTQKSEEIQEIIFQQESFLSQIIRENNEKDEEITYNRNNIRGRSYENYIIQFIHDLLNCFSSKDEFNYYNNKTIKTEVINKIFRKYQLEEIEDIELDFEIVNLKIRDFIDILIYLFPNYINLGNLKMKPFEKNMDFNELLEMKEKYKESLECIDIFGEIGVNVITEDEKIDQLIKYMKLFYNINYLVNNNKSEADFILNTFNLSNCDNRAILFISNGDYENFYERNLNEKTKFIKAQNIFQVNSLLVYIKDNNYSRENEIIDYLIFNNNSNDNSSNSIQKIIYQNKKKFIDNLVKQKQKNIKQNTINHNFRKFSYQLCDIERRINYIGKEYSKFLKKNKNLGTFHFNSFVDLFNENKTMIIENIELPTEKILYLELPGLDKIVTDLNRINIIILHYSKMNMSNIIKSLQQKISNSNVFDFQYENKLVNKNSKLFSSINSEYRELTKNNKNCINIFIFEFNDKFFLHLLIELCDNLKVNFLSYLFIIYHNNTENIPISYFFQFHQNHIYFCSYSNEIFQEITEKLQKLLIQMKKNYSLYLINRVKYNKIINEYNKSYKYEILDDIEGKKSLNLKNNIEQYKALFFEKIKQDLSFYLTLSLKEKNNIQISFKSEILKIIDEEFYINFFLENNTLINDFKIIICNFLDVLCENSNDEQFNEIFKTDDILTVNGLPYFNQNINKDEKKNDKIISPQEQINEFNNFLKSLYESDDKKKAESSCKYTQVSLLADDIKDNLKLSLKIINIKLYYKLFMSSVLRSFGDSLLNSLAKLIVENEDKEQ